MNKLAHVLVTFTFAFSCLGLWSLLNLFGQVSPSTAKAIPAFTALVVEQRAWLLFLPIPAVAYCLRAVLRRNPAHPSISAFLACSMSVLSLVFFPVLLAVFLPCVLLMEHAWLK